MMLEKVDAKENGHDSQAHPKKHMTRPHRGRDFGKAGALDAAAIKFANAESH